ncbi:hypothetical protein FACS189485_01670 [Spirochaetia bacterium]|nr:hypothetical protein FACS189485_01670 [Spirochaetia bacterium]
MKRFLQCAALLALVATVWSAGAFAQTTDTRGAITPKEFPQWTKDLRRAEIIAFGTFPFTMFAATFAMETWRYFDHDQNIQYAPWPFKTAGAINMSTDEHLQTMGIAAAVSVTMALTDFVITQVKRYKQKEKARNLPAGTPIIIKRDMVRPPLEEPTESPPLESKSSPAEP